MMVAADQARSTGRPSMLQKALRHILMRQATVSACEDVGKGFRLITFEGPQLRGADWIAGQKLQIPMGATFATRTYTPMEWDAVAGRTRILGYVHDDTANGVWARRAEIGDRHDLLGPRQSLDLSRVSTPLAVFGDETSIGLAYALQRSVPDRITSCHFETIDRVDVEAAMERLGLPDAELFSREEGDRHLELMEAQLSSLAAAGATFVLTGRAPAIQHLRQALNRLEVPSSRVMTKAYWAPGKIGLD